MDLLTVHVTTMAECNPDGELDPQLVSGNTKVKFPVTLTGMPLGGDDITDYRQFSDYENDLTIELDAIEENEEILIGTADDNSASDMQSSFAIDEEDIHVLEEYRALLNLFRELPRDMFVNQVLSDYSSSEPDLERIRTYYFEHLKQVTPDFPFGSNSELKRRMMTRAGEPVAVKLAQDIHTIIEVAEGGDCNVLKPLISTAKTRKQSVNKQADLPPAMLNQCACISEVALMKDTIGSIQAEMLMLKQREHAREKARSEESVRIKVTLDEIRKDLVTCASELRDMVHGSKENVRDIAGSLSRNILGLEDRIRVMEGFLDDNNIVTVASLNTHTFYGRQNDCEISKDSGRTTVAQSKTMGTIEVNNSIDAKLTETITRSHEQIRPFEHQAGSLDNTLPNGNVRQHSVNRTGTSIPVRITDRNDSGGKRNDKMDELGFQVQSRKHTKRFCLLGLSSRVNTELLGSIVTRKGPKVTAMRVFPLRNNPGKALVRLNVMADENADKVMNKGFWPGYVKCVPWRADQRSRILPQGCE